MSPLTVLGWLLAVLVGLALLLLVLKLLVIAFSVAIVIVPTLAWLALTGAGLYSVATSFKPDNTKLLWIIIILLAPVLGPLLWFFWGKKNT